MNDTVKEAISQFIINTNPKSVDTPKKRYKKSSRTVSHQSSVPTNSETILDINGIGTLREIMIVSQQKMNPYLIVDEEDVLRSINSWDQLAQITLYTTTIIAQTNGSDFILSFNKIHFMKNIYLKVGFDNKGTISRSFGVIDYCEEL